MNLYVNDFYGVIAVQGAISYTEEDGFGNAPLIAETIHMDESKS